MSDREAFEAWFANEHPYGTTEHYKQAQWFVWQAALVAQQKEDFCSQCGQPFTAPACGFSHATIQEERRVGKLAAQQKAEPDIPLGTRLYPAAGEFKAQRNELTATPLDPEGIRLLREARDYVASDVQMRRDMYSGYPKLERKWKPDADLLAEIDAYLAKYPGA